MTGGSVREHWVRGRRVIPPGAWAPALALATCIVLVACGDATGPDDGAVPGLAACSSSPPLTQMPVPIASIEEIGPLGVMGGGGHLFPATHLGVHQTPEAGTPVALSAPGSMVITSVARVTFTDASSVEADYAVYFSPCADVRMHFGHVTDLDPAILAAIGSWTDAECAEPYVVNGVSVQPCTKAVSIRLDAGASLGLQRGTMDWGAMDRRVHLAYVNPARMGGEDDAFGQNAMVCPTDYLPVSVQASIHDLFGEAGRRRTAEPVCGTVMQDIPGTAQGRWFISDDWNERLHLALVRDQVDPGIAAFSVGTSIPTLPTDLYRFDPVESGRVNLDFPHVRADGLIYCYEPDAEQTSASHRILIQLLSDTRLRIEGAFESACGAPESWAFSAGAVDFDR